MPLFPELRPYLEEVWDLAESGTEYVITRYRDSNANLRTQLTRIIRRAGLKQWPKLFQNLRSTRETELAKKFPLHVVCSWMGNSQPVAAKHYLQITDEHFQRAAAECTDAKAVRNQVQHPRVTPSIASQHDSLTKQEIPILQHLTSLYDVVYTCLAVRLGLEPRLMEPESIVLPITPSDSTDLDRLKLPGTDRRKKQLLRGLAWRHSDHAAERCPETSRSGPVSAPKDYDRLE